MRYTPGIYRTGGITLLNGISDPVPPLLFPLKVVHDRNQATPLQHTVAEQRLVDSGLTSGVYDLFPKGWRVIGVRDLLQQRTLFLF